LNSASKILSTAALCCAAVAALGQQTAPQPKPANAQSEAGEPRADTSSPSPPPAAAPSPDAPVAAHAPAAAPSPAPPAPARAASASAAPASAAPPARPAAAKTDRLELGTATVTGDREQPKVMYIVPWKRSDIGDLAGKPMNSLVDEILSPVDRDVFKREVVYYRAVQADASQNGAVPKPAPQGEK
jgi:hypothetical protein